MINFLHTFLPQPILFQFGFLRTYWYGIFIVAGIFAGLLVILYLAKYFSKSSNEVIDLVFYLIIFGILGGRFYAVILDWSYYWQSPGEIIAVWHGGLAIHGVVIGGLITLLVYCYFKKQNFWFWADLLAVALPLGQAIGRWGNYFNQEIFGRPTDLPWGIPVDLVHRPESYLSYQYFQPVFLYESVLDILNFLVLMFLFWRVRIRKQENKKTRKQPGLIFLIYLINYSIIRIGMEFLRLDDTPLILGWRWPILASAIIIIVSLAVIVYRQRLIKNNHI